ncbi:hypothetical protein DFH07DRAFT_503187 [Mycena maculata]|uniref:Uncharacterized protein n=1 Tax=Mycena maculata TaxID=230809 RepID=A0AAD7J031_9AGAR|nr:hypothetical protein DFH07DRAFT_503187 [Mycena maculata]
MLISSLRRLSLEVPMILLLRRGPRTPRVIRLWGLIFPPMRRIPSLCYPSPWKAWDGSPFTSHSTGLRIHLPISRPSRGALCWGMMLGTSRIISSTVVRYPFNSGDDWAGYLTNVDGLTCICHPAWDCLACPRPCVAGGFQRRSHCSYRPYHS